jgi:hypothetical protein
LRVRHFLIKQAFLAKVKPSNQDRFGGFYFAYSLVSLTFAYIYCGRILWAWKA